MSASSYRDWPSEYSVEVDAISEAAWYDLLRTFHDANVFQTWAFEATRTAGDGISHLVVRAAGVAVAAAQVRIVKAPLLPLGVAYVRWGPMWRPKGCEARPEHLVLALRALREEYVVRRGLLLRVLPYLFDGSSPGAPELLGTQFSPAAETAQQTIVMKIDRSLNEVRKNLDQKWRNCLNRSEKNSIEVSHGFDDAAFDAFRRIYEEMYARKRFSMRSDVDHFSRMQPLLPDDFKLRVSIAKVEGKVAAGLVVARIGDTGVYLLGGTTDDGMKSKASYLLQWSALEWLSEAGVAFYNLHGINPVANPGVYHFKAGLCGKNGAEHRYVGAYDCAAGSRGARLAQLVVAGRRALRRRSGVAPETRAADSARGTDART